MTDHQLIQRVNLPNFFFMVSSPFLEEILNVRLNLAIAQYILSSRNHGNVSSARRQVRAKGYREARVIRAMVSRSLLLSTLERRE